MQLLLLLFNMWSEINCGIIATKKSIFYIPHLLKSDLRKLYVSFLPAQAQEGLAGAAASRCSIKRQLSVPSAHETALKLHDVKKFLQVHGLPVTFLDEC